jgi:bacteriorhodopsin
MKNKNYHNVWTISKSNIKIAESSKFDTLKYAAIDMLTFLVFSVLCILGETEGKLISLNLLLYSVIIAFSG